MTPTSVSGDRRDASQLWGKDVFQTTEELQKMHPGARCAVIGPAAERLVRYAAIMNDNQRNPLPPEGFNDTERHGMCG